MHQKDILLSVIVLIGVAVFVVAILKKIRVSPVLGYLIAGAMIGEHGLKIIDQHDIQLLGELGVVFLLFAIGLELSFERLKAMRKYVFGLGSLQVAITALVISGAVALIIPDKVAALVIGSALSLSSTAIVLRVIEDSHSQSTQVGRISLAILLLQDLIVVPLLVIVPLVGSGANNNHSLMYMLALAAAKGVAALLGIFMVGRTLIKPLFKMIYSDSVEGGNELPIAMTLLIVLSSAWTTEYFGLSLALGAFVAGVLVAETEFRIQAEKSIYPFKSLLLGLFFMAVGMSIDVKEIYSQISHILILSSALIAIKAMIIIAFCILFGFNKSTSIYAGLLLAQGGEFAFILFELAKQNDLLEEGLANILLLVVTCSMALTPLLAMLGQIIAEKIERNMGKTPNQLIALGANDLTKHVIIAGFGKVGKMVARILESQEVRYIAIDINGEKVHEEKSEGCPIFRGDISSQSTLEALGIKRANTIILSIKNEITIKKTLKTLQELHQNLNLNVIIRLKHLKKSQEFYDLGVTFIVPEDYEIGLQLGGAALKAMGGNEHEINKIKKQFRSGDYMNAMLLEDSGDEERNGVENAQM
ncbi:Potassium-efflux system Kef-like protein [Rickettsiales endosymbiont of Paramecium tredecaurelia]|uniref:cation:proton antiporter domain-containing protein n=1 Tax=Candidatus Sarmatiella mevalonica TaxID=2770581 RepID=UPI0019226D7A|nr:cation:proton antiporter [Candidatus Sarmatiella mevalonica]MBL3284379.1 Potassium-efflux system Kef-like protein [Candidatus Sarmatiella mevalonica]